MDVKIVITAYTAWYIICLSVLLASKIFNLKRHLYQERLNGGGDIVWTSRRVDRAAAIGTCASKLNVSLFEGPRRFVAMLILPAAV